MTVATTSGTQPQEWWKKGALLSPMLNLNPLYSIVSPISVAKVEVNDEDIQDIIMQFVVPRAYHQKVIDGCCRDAGHQGCDQTWTLVEDRFLWPRAREDIVQAVAEL